MARLLWLLREPFSVCYKLDQWTRRRLRAIPWKQWSVGVRALRGCDAAASAGTWRRKPLAAHMGPWRLSNSPALAIALPNAFFGSLGVATLAPQTCCLIYRTAVYGPVRTVVWAEPRLSPIPIAALLLLPRLRACRGGRGGLLAVCRLRDRTPNWISGGRIPANPSSTLPIGCLGAGGVSVHRPRDGDLCAAGGCERNAVRIVCL